MGTVADLLSAQPSASAAPPPAQAGGVAPLPPGFVLDDSPPPPPPGFQVQGPQPPGVVKDLLAPGKSALAALQSDSQDFVKASKTESHGPLDMIPGVSAADQAGLRILGDVGGLALSPVTGALNAAVVQPAAHALDVLPAPLALKGGQMAPMTPAEQHAANEKIISTALMGLGPEGAEGGFGAIADAATAKRVAGIVRKVPASVALDGSGELTPEATEAATRADVHPQALKAGYQAVQNARQGPSTVADELSTQDSPPPSQSPPHNVPPAGGLTEAQVSQVLPGLVPGARITSQARSGAQNAATGGVSNSMHLTGQAVDFVPPGAKWTQADLDQFRQALVAKGLPHTELMIEEAGPHSTGYHVHWGWGAKGGGASQAGRYSTVADELSTARASLEPAQAREAPMEADASGGPAPAGAAPDAPAPIPPAPEAAPAAEAAAPAPEGAEAPVEEPPATAAARVAEAQSEGVRLSKGQATQDFSTQAKEQQLQAMSTPEADEARKFFAGQQQDIQGAVQRFKSGFGDPEATAEDRGQLVKDALTQLRDSGRAGVSAMYTQARQLAENLGDNSANLIKLDTEPLRTAVRGIMIDEGVPADVRSAIRQQAAQYGLMGAEPRVYEDGTATVRLRDAEGNLGPSVTLAKAPEPLTIANAEDLRQAINSLFRADTSGKTQALKPIIDDAVQAAVERAATGATGEVGQAFRAARAAHQAQQQTFAAKDVVQKLIDWKVRGVTPQVMPENAIKTVLSGGKDAVTNLKKVKAVLLSKPTTESRAAWQAIKAHSVSELFDQALVVNANPGEGDLGAISGAKLNTAAAKFGIDKLKVILTESEFNQLMKLRRLIGNATIPIKGTTNPSGSGWAVLRFLTHFVPHVGPMVHLGIDAAKMGLDAAGKGSTLEGIKNFAPEADAAAKQNPLQSVKSALQAARSPGALATITAGAANDRDELDQKSMALGR